ncbi:hypothetical protein MMC11_000081 [Xylographa trunciseda]|nr:hypothetical protein [Xylographa trunciseda]
MYLLLLSLLALATILPVRAFTNGTLVPAYFCNPVPDGMPKSLGELIPFTVKDQCADLAFNANATANLQDVPVTGSKPGNTGYMLASFHNTENSILPIQQVIQVTTVSGGPLIAGQANPLVLSSGTVGVALDGAMLYANNASGVRVGSFTDAGGIFKDFPGCGLNAHGQMAGVIHSQLITCNETYSMLSYNAPKCGNGVVMLAGLGVTDNGFGVWNQTMQVTGQNPFDKDGDCDGSDTDDMRKKTKL